MNVLCVDQDENQTQANETGRKGASRPGRSALPPVVIRARAERLAREKGCDCC